MMWLFLILACSGGAVLWAGIAGIFIRGRRITLVYNELRSLHRLRKKRQSGNQGEETETEHSKLSG